MGLVAGTGVLTAGGVVVVRPVAGSVVVVVAALEERVVRRTVGETAADTHAATATPSPSRVSPSALPLPKDTVTGLPSESQPPIGSLQLLFPMLNSSWSRAEKSYSPRSEASQAWWLQARRWPLLVAKADIYINNRTRCQAILRKSQ